MLDPIHPGEILSEDLEALDLSATEFARRLDVPASRITQILNGKRSITGDTALRLAHFFSTSAEFWLGLQSGYELDIAKQIYDSEIENLPTLVQEKILKQVAKASPSK